MSTAASSRELAEGLDPRLRDAFLSDVARAEPVSLKGHVVLVGHRAAGKSRLLEPLARRLVRPAVDLDAQIPGDRVLFERSQADFRRAERAAFLAIAQPSVIAAGGGFLFHHADLLEGHTAVLVPVTFETYCERLRADTTRPRLRPELSFDEELETVFRERDPLYRRCMPLARLVATLEAAS
jgi:shikimate kinase